MASGGKAINLGELAIAIALKTGALEAGLKDVQKQLKDHGKKVQETGADYDKLAIVAGVAFYKITSAIGSGVKAFNDFNSSMVGLKSVVQGTGNDFNKAQGFIDDFIKDGLVPASDAATGLKNLLSHGMGFEQAVDVMNRFKDSAAFARQGSLTLGEAIRGGTEGLKNSLSMMVDNTGVTENLSVMWDKYAKTIGKTAATLTDAEKVQAEYVGIMRATQFQVGDAAKYSEQFAGAQARGAAETLKLKQAFGESLVPALNALLSVITPVITALTNFVKNNPELVATLTLTATAFLAIITAITAARAAIALLGPAIAALKIALSGLMLNPVVLGLTALAVAGGVVATQIYKAKKEQDAYNKSLEQFNKVKANGITRNEAPQYEEEVKSLQKLVDERNKLNEDMKKFDEEQTKIENGTLTWTAAMGNRSQIYAELEDGLKKNNAALKANNVGYEEAKERIRVYTDAINEAKKATFDELNNEAKSVAQKKVQQLELQSLIDQYKKAKVGSNDYTEAQKKLAEQFPQFSTASGIMIDAIQGVVKTQEDSVKSEWDAVQEKIETRKKDLQSTIITEQAKQNAIWSTIEFENTVNGGASNAVMEKRIKTYFDASEKLKTLQGQLDALNALSNTPIDKITGVKPADTSGSSYDEAKEETKAYENDALDEHLKYINHKKALDEMSLEEELNEYEWGLKAFAQTADEKMDLEEKIYSVKKQIRERDKTEEEKAIEERKTAWERESQALQERTSNSTEWISREKNMGNLTSQEEISAYNRIIAYHKEYLDKIVADTQMAQDEKDKIISNETKTIQDQQDKIFEIQKANVEKAVNTYLDAKKKQYDTEEQLEDDRLNKKLKDLDKEYSDKKNALEAADQKNDLAKLYEEERNYQNAATKAGKDKLKEIRDKIASINKEATLDALDAEKEAKQKAINQEIEDNKNKYKKLNDDLTSEGAAMISASASYAQQANAEIVNGQNTIANSLKGIMTNFDRETTSLITSGMDNLTKLINGYKTIMDNVKLSPNVQLAGLGTSSNSKDGLIGAQTTVTINDYGNKVLSGIEDIQDYGKELVTGAENASRG